MTSARVHYVTRRCEALPPLPLPSCSPPGVGCAGGGDTDDAGESSQPGTAVTATVQRSTLFETRRALRLVLRNGANQELEIGAVQLSSPQFEPVPPEPRDVPLASADRVVIPPPFGTAQCDRVADEPPFWPASICTSVRHGNAPVSGPSRGRSSWSSGAPA
jgi:hypothetical protein